MSKFILPINNSVWGVIVRPVAGDTYRHILSFDSEESKVEFIGQELFNNKSFDFKAALATMPNKPYAAATSTSATVSLNVADVTINTQGINKEFTIGEMLNVDFMIAYEDGEYKYYTVASAVRVKNEPTVQYELELDIFMTYDIKEMFNDNPVEIVNAHYPRYDETATPILDMNSPNATPEEFDSSVQENIMERPVEKTIIEEDFRDNVVYNSELSINEDEQREIVNDILNNQQYLVMYGTEARADDESPLLPAVTDSMPMKFDTKNYDKSFSDPVETPYYVYVAPLKTGKMSYGENSYITSGGQMYRELNTNVKMLKNSATIVPVAPFTNARFDNTLHFKLYEELSQYKIEYIFGDNESAGTCRPVEHASIGIFNKVSLDEELKTSIEYELKYDGIPTVDTDIESEFDWTQETKIYNAPYRTWKIKSSTSNEFSMQPQLMGDKMKFNFEFVWNPEEYELTYRPQSSEGDSFYDVAGQNHIAFVDRARYQLPTEIDNFNAYMNTHKSQIEQSIQSSKTNGVLKAAIGIGGVVAAPFTGGASLAVSGAAVVSGGLGVVNASQNIKAINSSIADIARTPNSIENSGVNPLFDATYLSLNPVLMEFKPYEFNWKLMAEHFYKYGVSYGHRMTNINPLLDSRYYFNFIKAPQVFENINKRMSADIKQLVNDTVAEGVHIWHVRDVNTFKGIKNYNINNIETELIGIEAPITKATYSYEPVAGVDTMTFPIPFNRSNVFESLEEVKLTVDAVGKFTSTENENRLEFTWNPDVYVSEDYHLEWVNASKEVFYTTLEYSINGGSWVKHSDLQTIEDIDIFDYAIIDEIVSVELQAGETIEFRINYEGNFTGKSALNRSNMIITHYNY